VQNQRLYWKFKFKKRKKILKSKNNCVFTLERKEIWRDDTKRRQGQACAILVLWVRSLQPWGPLPFARGQVQLTS
jgi:hypothetical protein